MSAICGVVYLNARPTTPDTISSMLGTLAHRGSDAIGAWSKEGIALAHRMLHTTMESLHEKQPLVQNEPLRVLVADARIDNRKELIALLELSAGTAATDSEIILGAYNRWGRDCAERLIGDFAFAVWDERTRTLFCARDPMGVKPFYYAADNRRFAFATEIKALLVLPEIDASIDPEQIACFMGWFHEERSRTMYRAVNRLPAAHCLTVSPESISLERYWSPESARDVRFAADGDYIDAFREIFTDSVSARLRAAHPVGATLSGGLDSSSIVCVSRALRRSDTSSIHTFSLVFPDLPEKELRLIDERKFADAVIQLGGLQPHIVYGDRLSPLRDARQILWHLDEPYSAPNLYLHWGIFEAAAATGVRVLLDGFDGDTAVSHGFTRLTSLARGEQWSALKAEIAEFSRNHHKSADLVARQFVAPYLAELARCGQITTWLRVASALRRWPGLSWPELACDFGIGPLLPSLWRRGKGAGHRSLRDETAVMRRPLGRALRRNRRLVEREISRRGSRSEREVHIDGVSRPLYQLTLEMADKAAAAFGVETRYPFFDRRLIEFCIGLPEEQKFANGWPRVLLRRAMEGILPAEVQWRTTKANLSPNFYRRFRTKDLTERRFFTSKGLSRYLRPYRIREIDRRYRSATESEALQSDALLLFRAAVLELWLEEPDASGSQIEDNCDAIYECGVT